MLESLVYTAVKLLSVQGGLISFIPATYFDLRLRYALLLYLATKSCMSKSTKLFFRSCVSPI